MKKIKLPDSRVKVGLLVNDIVGYEITKFLLEQNENVGLMVIHEEALRKYGEELTMLAQVNKIKLLTNAEMIKTENVEYIKKFAPDIMVSCYWAYLLKPEIFHIPACGCLNFHPAMLPYNRGWYPSVYPFLDGTPAGVTLHIIDEGADTGPVLRQKEIPITPEDDSGTIYEKSQNTIIEMFKELWLDLKKTGVEPVHQDHSKATYHKKKDVAAYDVIDLTKEMKVGDLFNHLKARTFKGKPFAYFMKDNKKFKVKIEIQEEK